MSIPIRILTAAALCLGGVLAIGAAGALLFLAAFTLLSVRSARLLPERDRTTVDGVTTIDDAVAACRASGLVGLELAAYAQSLAARKIKYSRRNPWDSWARSFERGMGYCIQQGMALKSLLDRLGIEAVPVQSFRCAFPPAIVHGVPEPAGVSGHLWLRVRVDGKEYDVCPGKETNRPGVVHFAVLSPVRRVRAWTIPILHVFCAAENVRRDWKNLFARSGT